MIKKIYVKIFLLLLVILSFKIISFLYVYSFLDESYIKPTVLKNILNESECKHIIDKVKNKLTLSLVDNYNKKQYKQVLKHRKSKTAWLDKDDIVVNKLYNYLSKIVNKPINQFESLQVVKYTQGEYYHYHQDATCDFFKKINNLENYKNQRIYTFLIYLNEEYEGGETHFKNLDKKFKLKRGDGILFHTLDKDFNKCHINALHAGLPIKKGEKWICNIWIRENPINEVKDYNLKL